MDEIITDIDEGMPHKIALVIDGVVRQVLYCTTADASKFLSEPKFYSIPEDIVVENGYTFDGENFVPTMTL